MHRRFAGWLLASLVLPLLVVGCKPGSKLSLSAATPTPSVAPTTTPVAVATPTPTPAIDRSARFIVLCYHRFEDKPHDSLAIAPAEFKAQMQSLKDSGIAVVPLKDVLAWRRGEKNIPSKSAVITIDDGYVSGYEVAWPILKEFNYPFTMFIYTNWVQVGGKSMTWDQLAEMRDAGVDIESHTESHKDLRKAPPGQDYATWLHNEVYRSKQILEDKLGIKVVAFAFPYGFHNEVVRKTAMDAGYQILLTVYGQHEGIDAPADQIGRYAIESTHPEVFKTAINFAPGNGNNPGVVATQLASASMVTEPMNEEHVKTPQPKLRANLATMGEIDPGSVEMRVSGYGVVPAKYDPQTKLVSYDFTEKLLPKTYTVIVSAKVKGKRVETHWVFTVDAAQPVANN
ncbi:MAG: polysaccharide deacetylase family protein [Verrucomicrobia bacterium]|nr:polysaccharide deacetylase family protein [Verrucomicrobiota bacterium]